MNKEATYYKQQPGELKSKFQSHPPVASLHPKERESPQTNNFRNMYDYSKKTLQSFLTIYKVSLKIV